MREIKFRAWDDGKMFYSHNNSINTSNFQNKWFFEKVREDAIIMQYTGLKDKNGKEIYEGDIMQSEEFGYIGEVVWNEVIAGFKLKFSATFSAHIADRNDYMEVVGNIHENPELLS